ncbi:MAG: tetratricopeptide repeat protein [Hyphomonadaceae bacterium]|nr:tetratricopeptide repeat protein [Hyphomonadaceae bacterium]
MWSGFRASLLAATACIGAGCASSPIGYGAWFTPAMMEELKTQQEYADFIAARYAGMSGDPSAAAAYYRRAFGSEPADPGLLERATFATLVSGDAGEATRMVAAADASVAQRSPSAQLVLIVDEIGAGKTKSALQRLKTTTLGAINADVVGFLAAWLTATENADKGVATLAELPPRRLLAGEQAAIQGLIYLNAGRDEKAIDAFNQAQRLPLASTDLIASLNARLMASRGDYAGARKAIALEIEENGASSLTDHMYAMFETGQPVMRPKLSTRQGAAIIVYLASAGGIARSSAELAALRYSLALRLDPELAPARLAFAEAFNQQDRPEDAVEVLREIQATSPWRAEALIQQAWLLNGLDRPGEALVAADQALASSRRRDIAVNVADLNRINGNHERARKLYDEIIAADLENKQPDWRVLFARANALSAGGDWKAAEADALAALAIESDRPEIQNFLGFGWVERDENVQQGLSLIRKAAASRPDQGYIVDSLGWAHFRLGQYAEAVTQLERATELSPADAEIVDHLGDAYWRAGRESEARYQWIAALRLKPGPEREQSLRSKLDKGLPALPAASLASRP